MSIMTNVLMTLLFCVAWALTIALGLAVYNGVTDPTCRDGVPGTTTLMSKLPNGCEVYEIRRCGSRAYAATGCKDRNSAIVRGKFVE